MSQVAKSGSTVGGGWQPFCFSPETAGWGWKCETGHCHDEAARSLLAKVLGDILARFHAVEPRIQSLACWDKFFVNNPLDIKEGDDHALEIAFHLSGLFWPWWRGAFPLGGLLLCLRVVIVNPALITSDDPGQEVFIIGGGLTKFNADIDWHAAASGELSGSWAQIRLQHGARQILSSEPIGMSHNHFPPP